jgi:hypothetical protein
MSERKPIPASQRELSEESTGYDKKVSDKSIASNKRRENQRSVQGDDFKKFSVGLKDIDEAVYYYFNEVIRPRVTQNGKTMQVPVIYGSPERWKAVQADGYYRDKNGKIQVPLIMFKRTSVEKNRNLSNKLDANMPNNFGIFKKKYSKKNIYDRFTVLNNRFEVDEYYGVVMPDFVNLTYECVIFTDYVEQNNKIVEQMNYASDSYWGDPNRFQFRAMIDSYGVATELQQGQDRMTKTSFSISMLGHIIPDAVNAQINGLDKFYSKASIIFGTETDKKFD